MYACTWETEFHGEGNGLQLLQVVVEQTRCRIATHSSSDLHEPPSAVGTCDLLINRLIVTFRGMSTLSCLGGSCTS